MMKKTANCLCVLIILLFTSSICFAYTVTCREELSGQMVTVDVSGARNLDEAKSIIRNDPIYWRVHAESCRSGGSQEPMLPTEPDIDRAGLDYDNFDLESADPQICKDTCAGDPRCKAWTYVKPGYQGNKARCWLKNGKPQPRNNNCCVSGVKQ